MESNASGPPSSDVSGSTLADGDASLPGDLSSTKLSVTTLKLVESLSHTSAEVSDEAFSALKELLISEGSQEQIAAAVQTGVVEVLTQLFANSPDDDIKEQAVHVLDIIACSSTIHRDIVLQSGVLKPLVSNLMSSKPSLSRSTSSIVSNLLAGNPRPSWELFLPVLQPLANSFYGSQDEQVISNLCWVWCNFTDHIEHDKLNLILRSGICRKLVQLMLHESPLIRTPALRTVGNIVTGDDLATQVILNCGALEAFSHLLNTSRDQETRKDVCWAISNVTAGPREQIQQVMNSGLIDRLVEICLEDHKSASFEVQEEATWAISNAFWGDYSQVAELVEKGCATAVCRLMSTNDSKIRMACMLGMERVLKLGRKESTNSYTDEFVSCGAFKLLKQIAKNDDDDEVRKEAESLLKFFDDLPEGEPEEQTLQVKSFMNVKGGDQTGEPDHAIGLSKEEDFIPGEAES
eukprot:TRINITY_DN2811_c0_g1_i1.p1 TRINITY_DN2811_c0_g1~~TRINITY_DN2811_c0_g1_i1.p1  ORF type:complete len:473 (-),score=116.17 TRINITY_DN2811_c0_g1_i1:156-1547(-)